MRPLLTECGMVNQSQNDYVSVDFVLDYGLCYYSCTTCLIGIDVFDLTGLRTLNS